MRLHASSKTLFKTLYQNIFFDVAHALLFLIFKLFRFDYSKARNGVVGFLAFNTMPVRKNCILMLEYQGIHAETMPGFAKYFMELGFAVDVYTIAKNQRLDSFVRMNTDSINIFAANPRIMRRVLQLEKLGQYEYIFFNSGVKSFGVAKVDENLKALRTKIISLIHGQDALPEDLSHIFVLDDLSEDGLLTPRTVHPYFFGDVRITGKKQDTVDFISIGRFGKGIRDYDTLFNAMKHLLAAGITNFHVSLMGRGKIRFKIPQEIRPYITVYSNRPFEECFQKLEESDFFLPLLNPLVEEHQRYLSTSTSGSFQLIYTFLKPCILNEIFARKYSFTPQDSILYPDNAALGEAMTRAVLLTPEDYAAMQDELAKKAEDKRALSLKNLKATLCEPA